MIPRPMFPISSAAAGEIGAAFGYDQVIVIARRVGAAPAPHGEHCATWGIDADHRGAAAAIGRMLTRGPMGWEESETVIHEDGGIFAERAALRLAFPLLVEGARDIIRSTSRVDSVTGAPMPGTLADAARPEATRRLHALRAAETCLTLTWSRPRIRDAWLCDILDGRQPL